MEALKFRILTKDDEIDIYLKKFESFVGVRLPYDYSIRSKIVAAFKDDDMVGGYMLITKPKFRSLMFVPDAAKEQDAFFKKDDYEMMEINGVWMSAKLKSAADQYQIWISLIWDIFLSK